MSCLFVPFSFWFLGYVEFTTTVKSRTLRRVNIRVACHLGFPFAFQFFAVEIGPVFGHFLIMAQFHKAVKAIGPFRYREVHRFTNIINLHLVTYLSWRLVSCVFTFSSESVKMAVL